MHLLAANHLMFVMNCLTIDDYDQYKEFVCVCNLRVYANTLTDVVDWLLMSNALHLQSAQTGNPYLPQDKHILTIYSKEIVAYKLMDVMQLCLSCKATAIMLNVWGMSV